MFPNEPEEKSLDSFLATPLLRGILVVVTLIYQAIFIAIFTSKFFQTNKSKFVEHLNIREDLKEIHE